MGVRGKIAAALVATTLAASGAYIWYSDGALAAVQGKVSALFGKEPKRPERPPPTVVVAKAGTATVTRTVEAIGTTTAAESVTLAAEQPGRVVEIAFTDGQKVRQGQALVRLDSEIVDAELRNAEAEAKQIEQELGRAEYLLARGSGPRATVEDTQRRLQAARARAQTVRERVNDTVLRAPFAGRVGLRDISVGASVERSTVLAIVDAISPMDLRFTVPEQFLGQVQAGTKIQAKTAAFEGRSFEGEVRATASRVDPASRTISVEARLPNEDGTLLPGMLMNVTIAVQRIENAVVVPPMALVVRGNEQFVYVLGEESKVARKPVRSGQREPERVHVAEGLTAGEQIVVEGVQNVTDGQKVTIKDSAAPDGEVAGAKTRPRAGG